MHLGNHGWGMREMVIYLCVLAIILLFVVISIHSLYRRIDDDSKKRETPNQVVVEDEPVVSKPVISEPVQETRSINYEYYYGEETRLLNATKQYLNDKPTETGDGILKLDADSLINLGYMSAIYNDIGSSKCTGYSNIYKPEGESVYTIKSYIKCDNYTSKGF